jgi:hypothetical protein
MKFLFYLIGMGFELPNLHSHNSCETPHIFACSPRSRNGVICGRAIRQGHPMVTKLVLIAAGIVLGSSLATPLLSGLQVSATAFAQAAGMAGIANTESVSVRATVKAVDLPMRSVTLEEAGGKTVVLKVGDEVRNLAQVRPGDTVVAHYYTSSAYVLAPQGTKLPNDSLTTAGARAAPGEKPGAAAGSKMVVSGLVVGVDPKLHTVSLVDPSGGRIRSVNVVTPAGQKSMKLIKIGDTITAVITEAVLIAVEPAA